MKQETTFDLMYQSIWNPEIKVMPLAAIWLEKPLLTGKGITKRITEGDEVQIKDGQLVDCLDKPTHVITSCHGKVSSDFSIHVMDIKTQELSIVNI